MTDDKAKQGHKVADDDDEKKESSTGQLSNPQLNEKGKPTRKAINSAKQAHSIAKKLYERAKEGRIVTAGVILEQYGGAQPYDPAALRDAHQDWRNNFSTNFLASIIDRVKPQFLDPVRAADMLTYSSLPAGAEGGAEKSRIFGTAITRTIRGWNGWDDHLSMISQENVCFGNCVVARIDDDWRARVFRFDECYLPDGTGQHATKVQVWIGKKSTLLHDFLTVIEDREVAAMADYDFDGCVKTVNESNKMGSGRRDENAVTEADAKREGRPISDTFQDQTKTIETYVVLVREYEGGVALWEVSQGDGNLVRNVEKLHECMEDGITLFTLQTGNTKFYGSKGLGRMLVNLHIAIERNRNLAADQLNLSGYVVLLGDSVNFSGFQPTVRNPFILVDKTFAVAKEELKFNHEGSEYLDNKLVGLAESISGAFIPPNIDQGGSPNTKIEAAQKAMREIAVRQGVLGRFMGQAYDLIGMMQRGICSEANLKEAKRVYDDKLKKKEKGLTLLARKVWELLKKVLGADELKTYEAIKETKTADPEAVDCIVSMLEQGLTIEEIITLSLSKASPDQEVQGSDKDQATIQFIGENVGNPFMDQRKATSMKGDIMIGKDRTEQLLIPEENPAIKDIAQRQQLMELGFLQSGQALPAAVTDNHDIHLATIYGHFEPAVEALLQTPTAQLADSVELTVSHGIDHLAKATTMLPPVKAEHEAKLKEWQSAVERARQALATQAENMPPPVQPGQPAPIDPEQVKLEIEAKKTQAELVLKSHDGELRERDQLLREQQQDLQRESMELDKRKQSHAEGESAFRAAKDTADLVATKALEARKAGLADAEKDLSENS